MVLHLSAIPPCNRSGRELAVYLEDVAPSLDALSSEDLACFCVKDLVCGLYALVLCLGRLEPSAHEVIPEVSLSVHALASEVAEHLVECRKRLQEESHERIVEPVVVNLAMLVVRETLEVAVGEVLNLLHPLLLRISQQSSIGDTACHESCKVFRELFVCKHSLDSVLPNRFVCCVCEVNKGLSITDSVLVFLLRILDFLADSLLLLLAVLDVLYILSCELKSYKFVLCVSANRL